jgi:iron complex outermembrane receptor protein
MRNKSSAELIALPIVLSIVSSMASDFARADESDALGEIVVTARKKSENIQDVALSVSALEKESLDRRFDVDLQSWANAAPNVVIDDLQQGPGSPAAIAIRGIGTTDVEKSFDPATGVVVDGIFIGVNSGAMLKAIDVQGVEILRGPQGTLFGRNSIAGVINVTRDKPSTDEVKGSFRASYGNYNSESIDGTVNLPVTDTFALRIGAAKNSHDGYFTDVTANPDTGVDYGRVGALDYRSMSAAALWKPIDVIQLNYRFDKSWQRQDAPPLDNMAQPDQLFCSYYHQCAQSLTTPQGGNRFDVLENAVDKGENSFFNTEMHSFSAGWEFLPAYRVDYLFGYFKTAEGIYQDFDATPLELYETNRPATYYQHSHELRVTHAGDGPFTYTAGLYAWNSGYRIDLTSYIGFGDALYGLAPGTIIVVPQTVQQKTDSQAAFFEGDYRFLNDWTFTAGGRYTKDKKTSGLIDPSMPELATRGNLANPFEDSWQQFTPKASLKYNFTADWMAYGLFSEGYRAGGFDGRPGTYGAASTPYNPEKVYNYELGTKTEFFDHRLRVNADFFYMKYKDKQEEESVPTTVGTGQETLVINASSATLKGFEMDAAAILGYGFSVSGNLGILQAKYDKLIDPTTGADLSSLHLRRSPPVTASISPLYQVPVGTGTASVQIDYHYIGPEALTFLNSPQSNNPHQNILNATVNYKIKSTTISAYGTNLTNNDAWAEAYDVGAGVGVGGLWTYAAPRPPRLFGVRVMYTF